jgi:hypothetical protein
MAEETTTGHEIYAARTIKGLTRQLAPLKAFSIDFSDEAKAKGETVNVSLVTPDTVAAWNATNNNFKRSTKTVNQAKITFGEPIITGFALSATNIRNFRPEFWQGKADLNTLEICDNVLATIAALITGANYGDTANDKMAVSLAGFSTSVVAAIRAKAIADKKLRAPMSVLALNPVYFSELLGKLDANVYGGRDAIVGGVIPGLLGFRAVIEIPQLAIPGFVCHPDAIAVAARAHMPASNKPYEAVNAITEPETGLTLTHVEYCSGDDGSLSDSVSALVASGVGNKNSLLRLIEAA